LQSRARELLRQSRDGIEFGPHIDAANGATVFVHVCKLGLKFPNNFAKIIGTMRVDAAAAAMRIINEDF
jgi:hypothetical protein